MSDQEFAIAQPPLPLLRVAATYEATDGRVPSDLYIEIGGDGPIDPSLIDRAVDALARVAAVGRTVFAFGDDEPVINLPDSAYARLGAGR